MFGVFFLVHEKKYSPKETVGLCFTNFNDKDEKGMKSFAVDKLKKENAFPDRPEYVYISSCYGEMCAEKINYDIVKENWYPDAEYVSKVYVTFDIKYVEDAPSKSGFDNGVCFRIFHL